MQQLIEITTVPIQIEVKTTDAKWEPVQGTAELELSKNDSGVSVRSRSVRLNLDTYENLAWLPLCESNRLTRPRRPTQRGDG